MTTQDVIFLSDIETRFVFTMRADGSFNLYTQEQFHEKRQKCLHKMADIFQRMSTPVPREKGKRKEALDIRKPACEDFRNAVGPDWEPWGMNTDINGLLACPKCGELGKVRLQTPPDDDGVIRRAYFRCFGCHALSPNYPDWTPCSIAESGRMAWEPLKTHWNDWVKDGAK